MLLQRQGKHKHTLAQPSPLSQLDESFLLACRWIILTPRCWEKRSTRYHP